MNDRRGTSYEWLHNRDTPYTHRNCGGKIIHEKQVNAAETGICDFRYRCLRCNYEFFEQLLKYERRNDMEKKKKIVTEDMEDIEDKLEKLKEKVVND